MNSGLPCVVGVLVALSLTACLRVQKGAPRAAAEPPAAAAPSEPALSAQMPLDVGLALPGHNQKGTEAALERVRSVLAALAAGPRFALGHEDTTAYGVGWKNDTDRSDVKSLCGAHVAVYGWDVFRIERDRSQNGDGVNFEHMRQLITDAHRRGGINTISWHADNPLSGGDAWDTKTRAVRDVLPGQPQHALYQSYLDRVANYLQTLRGDQGELIPIIFRPYHEHTGSWFWWGGRNTSADDYIALWRYTVDYLRSERGLSNLLFALSPSAGDLRVDEDYLFRYPGDDYVDIFGVDVYYGNTAHDLTRVAEIVVRMAEAHGKIPAVTEFGARNGLNAAGISSDWMTASLLSPLRNNPLASKIAYALAWRNARADHCFLPYPGHAGAEGFKAFCDDNQVVLQDDLPL